MNRDINEDYYLRKLKNDNKISFQNNQKEKNFYTLSRKNNTNLLNWKDIRKTSYRQTNLADNYKCPLMIDSPWNEFKSGDDVPEPYNI